ncbi:hypothetical protein [Actibacterium ureilyticum]|uniref:hypothetical protein n=1 Tax=Actibacterium ureilyticum TaxID=1590614 RepID=UPI000BAB0CEF|nr:hypothetical protein [Actibacterium ureilyticum]
MRRFVLMFALAGVLLSGPNLPGMPNWPQELQGPMLPGLASAIYATWNGVDQGHGNDFRAEAVRSFCQGMDSVGNEVELMDVKRMKPGQGL